MILYHSVGSVCRNNSMESLLLLVVVVVVCYMITNFYLVFRAVTLFITKCHIIYGKEEEEEEKTERNIQCNMCTRNKQLQSPHTHMHIAHTLAGTDKEKLSI